MKIFKSKKTETNTMEPNSVLEFQGTLEEKIDNFLTMSNLTRLKLDEQQLHNMLSTVFNSFGYTSHFPRKGDVNERFDARFQKENFHLVAEIEIPTVAILDAPRNLLDDLAVFSNRRDVSLEYIQPVVIAWDIPNKRTDYWNVVSDIEKILGIKVYTISLVSLAILYWTKSQFIIEDYYLNNNCPQITVILKILEDNGVNAEKYLGYFSPIK